MSDRGAPKNPLAPRGRIGVIVPARNSTVEIELGEMRPPGISHHVARMPFLGTPADYDPATAKVGAYDLDLHGAVDRLVQVDPDLMLLGHSHDSFIGGVAGGRRMQEALSERAGRPLVVPSMAYLAAIQTLKIANVAVLTPYLSVDDAMVAAFFEDAGCAVKRVKPLKYDTAYAIAATEPDVVRDTFRELDGDDVDAILQVGTNLPAARLAAAAELSLAKPVLSVNAVTYWHALRRLGIDDRIEGFGSLLGEH
jgi:maleate isomerase